MIGPQDDLLIKLGYSFTLALLLLEEGTLSELSPKNKTIYKPLTKRLCNRALGYHRSNNENPVN